MGTDNIKVQNWDPDSAPCNTVDLPVTRIHFQHNPRDKRQNQIRKQKSYSQKKLYELANVHPELLQLCHTLWCGCAQLCLILCNLMDCGPLGSSVHGISRQEYWSWLSFPIPGDLPDPRIKPSSLESPTLSGRFFTTEPPGKPQV